MLRLGPKVSRIIEESQDAAAMNTNLKNLNYSPYHDGQIFEKYDTEIAGIIDAYRENGWLTPFYEYVNPYGQFQINNSGHLRANRITFSERKYRFTGASVINTLNYMKPPDYWTNIPAMYDTINTDKTLVPYLLAVSQKNIADTQNLYRVSHQDMSKNNEGLSDILSDIQLARWARERFTVDEYLQTVDLLNCLRSYCRSRFFNQNFPNEALFRFLTKNTTRSIDYPKAVGFIVRSITHFDSMIPMKDCLLTDLLFDDSFWEQLVYIISHPEVVDGQSFTVLMENVLMKDYVYDDECYDGSTMISTVIPGYE
jgi:hypothetical protein